MGCPILLGYAEKAKEISKTWAASMAQSGDYPPDMTREAMRARAPFKDALERRAKVALQCLVFGSLKQVLTRSSMRTDAAWLDEVDASSYKELAVVVQRIKDRAVAWNVNNSMLAPGKVRTEGEFEMVFIDRVWQVASLADALLHDMAQESYTTAGTALAQAMAIAIADTDDWLQTFERLKEAE